MKLKKPTADIRRATLLTVVLVLSCTQVSAANLWCTGALTNLFVNAPGDAYVIPSWRGDYVKFCNVNQDSSGGVSPTNCLTWVALMRSAMQRNVETTMYYHEVAAATCGALPTYNAAPIPYYVMLKQ